MTPLHVAIIILNTITLALLVDTLRNIRRTRHAMRRIDNANATIAESLRFLKSRQ